jgi:5-methylthioadenosine/S-adenosylhomocysteine deaminase
LCAATASRAIGPADVLREQNPDARSLDASGKLLLPGFANVHTHMTMSVGRGVNEDIAMPNYPPYTPPKGPKPFTLPELTDEETILIVRLAALAAIRSGTTAIREDNKTSPPTPRR